MQVFDPAMLIIWWMIPLLILAGRAALASWRTKKKRDELRRLEEKSTPLTRGI